MNGSLSYGLCKIVLCFTLHSPELHREGVVATSLDSKIGVLKKYPRAVNWLPKLHTDGAQARPTVVCRVYHVI